MTLEDGLIYPLPMHGSRESGVGSRESGKANKFLTHYPFVRFEGEHVT